MNVLSILLVSTCFAQVVDDTTIGNSQLSAAYSLHEEEILLFAESLQNPGTNREKVEAWIQSRDMVYSIGLRKRIVDKLIDRLRNKDGADSDDSGRWLDPDRTTIRDRIKERRDNFWAFIRNSVMILLILTWAAIMYKLW